jgi:hypothetical protein
VTGSKKSYSLLDKLARMIGEGANDMPKEGVGIVVGSGEEACPLLSQLRHLRERTELLQTQLQKHFGEFWCIF